MRAGAGHGEEQTVATFHKVAGAVSLRKGGKLKRRSQSGWWRWGKETGRKRGKGVPGRAKSKCKGPGVGLGCKGRRAVSEGQGQGRQGLLARRGGVWLYSRCARGGRAEGF